MFSLLVLTDGLDSRRSTVLFSHHRRYFSSHLRLSFMGRWPSFCVSDSIFYPPTSSSCLSLYLCSFDFLCLSGSPRPTLTNLHSYHVVYLWIEDPIIPLRVYDILPRATPPHTHPRTDHAISCLPLPRLVSFCLPDSLVPLSLPTFNLDVPTHSRTPATTNSRIRTSLYLFVLLTLLFGSLFCLSYLWLCCDYWLEYIICVFALSLAGIYNLQATPRTMLATRFLQLDREDHPTSPLAVDWNNVAVAGTHPISGSASRDFLQLNPRLYCIIAQTSCSHA